MRDHPRVCGEEYQRGGLDAAQKGSPPRMRGREGQPGRVERGTGITPAYAGKSRPAVIIAGHFRDHPRVCGEELVRGTQQALQCRITPAYAGKSFRSARTSGFRADHPRACGEEWGGVLKEAARKGSPPRMRGRAGQSGAARRRGGITPAHAGKRISGSRTHRHSRDHPRACGEERSGSCIFSGSVGSPPRMRGRVEDKKKP